MARVMLFALAVMAVIVGGFSFFTRGRRNRDREIPPQVTINGVPVRPVDIRVRNALVGAQDARAITFLRRTLTMAEVLRADEGKYTSDPRKLVGERPANVSLYIIRVGDDGLRMTAVDNVTNRQCDVFAGDSAHWSFGYAFDPRVPACGTIR
jgi:hypothetical protein